MQTEQIFDILTKKFGNDITPMHEEAPGEKFVIVKADKIFDVCLFLRDDEKLDFDYMMCLTGVHKSPDLGVVYHLYSIKHKHKIVVKTFVPIDAPNVPTVERIWRSADWHEREAYDMYGINFEGHHNLIRILCPYDWEGFPLRKDYKTPEEYHGMRVPY
jgi:NADH-quinone oxidoreductase subunit C